MSSSMAGVTEILPIVERAENYVSKDAFERNAIIIQIKAVELLAESDQSTEILVELVEKILHSILFLGNIQERKLTPEEIFGNVMSDETKKTFPRPFTTYTEYVPLRTPFSYFLELVVTCFGESSEVQVKNTIKNVCSQLWKRHKKASIKTLASTVICICQSSAVESSDAQASQQVPLRYYGGSLSCSDDIERKIMTTVSCVHVWHPSVSYVVMSSFLEDTTEPPFSITLPDSVECRAYAVKDINTLKPPCQRCHELYNLADPEVKRNDPGKCAETEAISNLLDKELRYEVQFSQEEYQRKQERMKEEFQRNIEKRKNRGSYTIEITYD